MERILVTGGAGFVGSHLVEKLMDEGAHVTVIDDLSTGRWQNVRHLEGRADFRFLVASIMERDLVEQEVGRSDFVYHLASAVGVRFIMDHPIHTINTIFEGTEAVLSACAKYRVPVLITSTSEVYGKSTSFPFSETDDVVMGSTEKRRWAYACAKALDEFLAFAHFHETGLPVYVVRLFNTVGRRQTDQYGMVLPTFVRQAVAGEPLTVHGHGNQRRCFCSVHDVVRALAALRNTPRAQGMVINIGSQEETTMEELARRVIAASDSNSSITHIPYEQAFDNGFDDMQRRVPDLTRARELLGWEPTTTLDMIVADLVGDAQLASL